MIGMFILCFPHLLYVTFYPGNINIEASLYENAMKNAFFNKLGELTVPENQRNFATKENLPTYPEKIAKLKAEGANSSISNTVTD